MTFGVPFNAGAFKPVSASSFGQVTFPTQAASFVTQPGQSQFFNFQQAPVPQDNDEDDEDDSYVEGQSDNEEDGDAEVIQEAAMIADD